MRIGGAYQGKGNTPTAKNTTVEKSANIDVSATGNGKGGEVIVWADKTTHFAGDIKATGGGQGGNGGFVETSGKEKLSSTGSVNASAFAGEAGQWLLDPTNAILANGAGTDASAGGTFSGQAAIDATTIQTALNGGTSVTITTNSGGADAGDITLSNVTISKTTGGDATLTLKAENSILTTGNNSITSGAGKLGFVLWADSDNSGAGAISLVNTNITTNGGRFIAAGGLDNGANGGTASDNIPDNFAIGTATHDDGITLTNTNIATGVGVFTLLGKGVNNAVSTGHLGVVIQTHSTAATTSGAVTIKGTGGNSSDSGHGVYINGSDVSVTSDSGPISVTGIGGGTGTSNRGIYVISGAGIVSNGIGASAATVTLNGNTGGGTDSNNGVLINGTGSRVTSKDGNISITGTSSATGNGNRGTYLLSGGTVSSTGSATIDVTGNGGMGTGNTYGVLINGAGSSVTSKNGNIAITGTGGTSGPNNRGVYLLGGGTVSSTGTASDAATVTINGTGGNGTSDNYGVFLNGAGSNVTTKYGNVVINGTGAGSTSNNHGVYLALDADVLSTGPANISLTATAGAGAGSMDMFSNGATITIGGGTATGNVLLSLLTHSLSDFALQTSGNVTLQPRDASATVGVAGGAGALDIGTGLLDAITAGGTLTIGRADGDGAMTVNPYATWATRAGTGIRFLSNDGAITLAAGAHSFGARNLTIETDADPTVTGTVTGTGTLTLMPSSATQTMGIAGGAGTLNISNADLTNLGTGWSGVNLGRTDGTGLLTQGAFTWFAPTVWRAAATGAGVLVSAAQSTSAASNATFTFGAPLNLSANLDTSAATGGTRAIALNGATTLGTNTTVNAGSGNVTFGSTLNGGNTLGVTTSGDVTFTGAAGNIVPLGNVTVTGAHNVAANGGVNVGGDVNVTATNAITGSYMGINGSLNAGAGTITATTSFGLLDIQGAGATLSAGYIGSSAAPSQEMANRISIGGVSYPNLTPNAAYTFAGYTIGETPPAVVGGGGSSSGGPSSGGIVTPTPPPIAPGGTNIPPIAPQTPPEMPPNNSSSGGGYNPVLTTILTPETHDQLQRGAQQYSGSTVTNTPEKTVSINNAFSFGVRAFTQTLLEYSDELLELIGCGSGNADDSCQNL